MPIPGTHLMPGTSQRLSWMLRLSEMPWMRMDTFQVDTVQLDTEADNQVGMARVAVQLRAFQSPYGADAYDTRSYFNDPPYLNETNTSSPYPGALNSPDPRSLPNFLQDSPRDHSSQPASAPATQPASEPEIPGTGSGQGGTHDWYEAAYDSNYANQSVNYPPLNAFRSPSPLWPASKRPRGTPSSDSRSHSRQISGNGSGNSPSPPRSGGPSGSTSTWAPQLPELPQPLAVDPSAKPSKKGKSTGDTTQPPKDTSKAAGSKGVFSVQTQPSLNLVLESLFLNLIPEGVADFFLTLLMNPTEMVAHTASLTTPVATPN
ncbi:hypothetical protein B0T26DRAFT_747910 [Lasiosphaeria miniovina]|uniref:Uncharacterized protein n=1 Tax=Lasiosphaeria miniovina TaxID=1954250 RepID=A0AA40B573_9PEZI|nr:uncharacterized protein B0T26DRAFT_747910 [Lasiosphaeria miniovina]KAK0727598.1 hypothetical protein B0T26DRAFT_747910 [Lasiosphaeria miniovina]